MDNLVVRLNDRNRIAGKTFGRLTVIGQTSQTNNRRELLWNCLCDCGNQRLTTKFELNKGNVNSCGCLWKESRLQNFRFISESIKSKDLTGKRIGLVKVIQKVRKGKDLAWIYEYVCECGVVKEGRGNDLRRNLKKYPISCGCKGKNLIEHCTDSDGQEKWRLISTKQVIPVGIWNESS